MAPWLMSIVAIISISLCLFLWFRDVWRVMRERESTVESAARQLAVWREKARSAQAEPESQAILERSESIYRQAVELYHQTLHRPWNYLPARLMGFHPFWSRSLK